MAVTADRGMTGRDVVARTFSTKTRRGYDPAEVDAYLEKVGRQIDVFRSDIDRLNRELAEAREHASRTITVPPPAPIVAEVPVVEAPAPAAAPVVETAAGAQAADIVLQMAQKTSTEAIEAAELRAAEIVYEAESGVTSKLSEAEKLASDTIAEAEFKAAEMGRESDRKAFEAASRSQGELRAIQAEIEQQRSGLDEIDGHLAQKRDVLRGVAGQIMAIVDATSVDGADDADDEHQGNVIDLAAAESSDEVAEATAD